MAHTRSLRAFASVSRESTVVSPLLEGLSFLSDYVNDKIGDENYLESFRFMRSRRRMTHCTSGRSPRVCNSFPKKKSIHVVICSLQISSLLPSLMFISDLLLPPLIASLIALIKFVRGAGAFCICNNDLWAMRRNSG